jgi:hypothetical protein
VVCRELVAAGVVIHPALRERLIACMLLSKTLTEASVPLIDTGGQDLAVVSQLDGRFDARAYRYIQVRLLLARRSVARRICLCVVWYNYTFVCLACTVGCSMW